MKSATSNKTSTTSKMKNFPKIIIGSQKLRTKIKERSMKIKRKKQLLKNRLVCEKCYQKFPTWWEIREHWLSSGHKEPEECRWCRKKTYALQSHLCKEHWNLACMCTYCGQLFMFREGLEDHEKRHDGKEFRCYLCGKRQKTHEVLKKHIFKHYVYERYGCNVCEKRFKKKKNVEKHLKWVHYICQYCGNSCENKDALEEHWKKHDDLKCVYCKKVFSQKNRLKYHYQIQHGHQDFYKCSLCFQRFAMKSKLLDHLKLKHKGYAKISCETCEMPFLYWSQYLRHFEQAHAVPEDKFFCSFCDFSTPHRSKLQWHVEKTSGDGFFCKACQTRFQCKTKFDEHMKIHEGKSVYNCEYCDRSYATADVLKHHVSYMHKDVIISSNPRGYPCLIPGCSRYYVSKNSLARHLRRNHPKAGESSSSGQYCASNTVECRFPLVAEKRNYHQHDEFVVSSTQTNPDESEDSDLDKSLNNNQQKKTGYDEEEVLSDTASTICPVVTSSGKNVDQTDNPIEKPVASKRKKKTGYEEGIVSDTISVNSPAVSSSGKSVDQTDNESESEFIEVDVYYCDICSKFWFSGDKQFRRHMTTHNKQVWDDECLDCDEILESPEDAVRHYVEDHLKAEYLRFLN